MKITPVITGPFATNAYIVMEDGKCILIDAPAPDTTITGALESMNAVPEWVILTHGHFDHVLALPALKEKYPKMKIAISAADAIYLTDNMERIRKDLSFFYSSPVFEKAITEQFPKIDMLINDGDMLPLGFTAILTPGHTPGSMCFENKKEKVLFTGDTLFEGSIGRTDMPFGDYNSLQSSLIRILERENAVVLPGHGGSTTIKEERENNPYSPY